MPLQLSPNNTQLKHDRELGDREGNTPTSSFFKMFSDKEIDGKLGFHMPKVMEYGIYM